MEDENFETWKEMVRCFARQIMNEDEQFKSKFKEFAHSKYVMESMVRPWFGDSEQAYDFWLVCIDGACEL